MRIKYIIFACIINVVSCYSQINILKKTTGKVCAVDDDIVLSTEIINSATKIDPSHPFNSYLKKIKKALYQKDTYYTIKTIKNRNFAVSSNIEEDNKITSVIIIDEDYYAKKVLEDKQSAMFIWIIAHEITHHINKDFNSLESETSELTKMHRELLCDENAGFVLGKLTDIKIDEIEALLTAFLKKNENTTHHPDITYRIIAAKGGWLRAKTENWDAGKTDVVLGSQLRKIKGELFETSMTEKKNDKKEFSRTESDSGILYIGNSSQNGLQNELGLTIRKLNEKIDFIYFGFYSNGKANGLGKIIQDDITALGNFKNGEMDGQSYVYHNNLGYYKGNIVKNKKDGFGVFFFNDGNTYSGNWKNNEYDGFGVLYNSTTKKVLKSGCWEKGKLILENHECE